VQEIDAFAKQDQPKADPQDHEPSGMMSGTPLSDVL